MGERTLSEIIEAIKDGQQPSYEELYWSALALSYLHAFDAQDMLELAEGKMHPAMQKLRGEESWRRNKMACEKPPQDYVGKENDPHNPEYQKQRQTMKMVAGRLGF